MRARNSLRWYREPISEPGGQGDGCGRVGSLSEFLPVDDTRLTQFLGCLRRWAEASSLEQAARRTTSPPTGTASRVRRHR
jgi:hypothetical protein